MRVFCMAAFLALTGCAGTLTVNDGATVKHYRVKDCAMKVNPVGVLCTDLSGETIGFKDFKEALYEDGIFDSMQYEPTPGCCGQ